MIAFGKWAIVERGNHRNVATPTGRIPRLALWPLLLPLLVATPLGPMGCADPNAADPSGPLRTGINALLADHPEAEVAVALIDPVTETYVDIQGGREFHAASTMKVPVLIEVHRQAEAGRFSLDDSLLVENRFTSIVDGSPFRIEDDSDDDLYASLGLRVPIHMLVERMITVSSNLATNLLIGLVRADSVQRTIERMGTKAMRVLRGVEDIKAFERGLSNTATASDMALLLDAIRRGEAVSAEASRAMEAILLEQTFHEMIPAGLPDATPVAHKTGRITGIVHDAAIVHPGDPASYVLVILTEGFEDHDEASRLGANVARLIHATIR